MSLSPLAFVVFFGSAQNILSRGAKYSVFDATKEMAFVPLCPESKLVGKAVIDGVCSRMGKSGGSVVLQSLFLFFSSLSASSPYVAAALLIVLVVWIVAVRLLGKQFNQLTTQSKGIQLPIATEELAAIVPPANALPAHAMLAEQQAV